MSVENIENSYNELNNIIDKNIHFSENINSNKHNIKNINEINDIDKQCNKNNKIKTINKYKKINYSKPKIYNNNFLLHNHKDKVKIHYNKIKAEQKTSKKTKNKVNAN